MKKTKKKILKYKKEIIIGAVVLVVAIIAIVFLVMNSKEEPNNNNNQEENKVYEKVPENTLEDVYGMTKEDAITIVKQRFNSDNFEFSAEITSEGKYLVIAKNVINQNEYKYEVDPMTKECYELY